jgi:hypothetical protein
LGRLPELFLRGWLALAMYAAVGYAVATFAKSQLAGIAVGVVLYIGEPIARFFLSDILQYFPFGAASALVSGMGGDALGGGGSALGASLDADAAVLVVAAWLVGALAFTSVVAERADVGG